MEVQIVPENTFENFEAKVRMLKLGATTDNIEVKSRLVEIYDTQQRLVKLY